MIHASSRQMVTIMSKVFPKYAIKLAANSKNYLYLHSLQLMNY